MKNQNKRAQRVLRAKQLLAQMAMRQTQPKLAESAFNSFYKEFGHEILGTCTYLCKKYNILCAREYAKDICQDALLKVYLNADKYNPEIANPITWISTIARNELLNRLRNQIMFTSLDELSIDPAEESNTLFMNEETRNPLLDKIEKAFNALSEREKDIIRTTILYAPGNVPSHELERIAETHGISKEYIKTLRRRGFGGMRDELDNDGKE